MSASPGTPVFARPLLGAVARPARYATVRDSDVQALTRFVRSVRTDLKSRQQHAAEESRPKPEAPSDYERVKALVVRLRSDLPSEGP